MLGLPPAFVLSQDQTLKLKSCYQLILDVRTSAHRFLPLLKTGTVSVCCASGFIRNRKPPNSEADTPSSDRSPRSVRYANVRQSISTKPPTYLFRYHQFQRAQRQKLWKRLFFLGAPAARFVSVFVPVECFALPVRGYLRLLAETRKSFFSQN